MATLSEINGKRPFTHKQAWGRVYWTLVLDGIWLAVIIRLICTKEYGLIFPCAANVFVVTHSTVIVPISDPSKCFRAALSRNYVDPVFDQRETNLIKREDRIFYTGGVGAGVGVCVLMFLAIGYFCDAIDGVQTLLGATATIAVATIGVFKLMDAHRRLAKDFELFKDSSSYEGKRSDLNEC